MKTLNLVHPKKSDIQYKVGKFPDGEPTFEFVNLSLIKGEKVSIQCRLNSPEAVFQLCLVCDILTRWEIEYEIHISYLMCQRMDRVMDTNRPFSLKVMYQILKTLKCDKITTYSIHSTSILDKTFEFAKKRYPEVTFDILDKPGYIIVYPDNGAYQKYRSYFDEHYLAHSYPRYHLLFKKKRDLKTGNIESIEFDDSCKEDILYISKVDKPSFIIIDDLIDGGRTLIEIRKQILTKFPDATISICVTHAVNQEGLVNILSLFDDVYITNSYCDWDKIINADNLHIKYII